MAVLGESVCPVCQVLLPEGASICVKCGAKGEPERMPEVMAAWRLYPHFVRYLGHVGAAVACAILTLLLLIALVGLHFWLR